LRVTAAVLWCPCLILISLIVIGGIRTHDGNVEPSSPFLDETDAAGITFEHQRGASSKKHLVETQGSGCALFDYDADGWLDILLINGGSTPDSPPFDLRGHALYHNRANGTFQEVTAESGLKGSGAYGMGVAVGDYDNDGYPDVYLTNFGPNILYHNNGDGTFTDVSSTAGVSGSGWSTSAAFFDFDNDGNLDLFVTRYVDYSYEKNLVCSEMNIRSYCHPKNFAGVSSKLYRNLGQGHFQDVSERSGIANAEGKGLGVVAADFDSDGWMDIYVANDTTRNFLYRNNRDGTFSDVTLTSGTGYNIEGEAEAGMGTDAGDYDGDGLLDIFVTNYDLETNALYHNEGGWLFSDDRWPSGLAKTDHLFLGFGAGFVDFDNDGDQDLFLVNGHVLDNADLIRDDIRYLEPAQLLENKNAKFFENIPFQRYASLSPKVGRGATFGDIDNDGDLDILVNNSGQKATLLVNPAERKGNWILLKLIGVKSNRDAVGARITVTTEHSTLVSQVRGGRSYLSASDIRVHFGLGNSKLIKSLKIRWPSGAEDAFQNLRANQILSIKEGVTKGKA
jgi:enediyne biosynthesis protein E4